MEKFYIYKKYVKLNIDVFVVGLKYDKKNKLSVKNITKCLLLND